MSDKIISIMVVKGVEGPSLYINDYRIIGNKPWGGGTTFHEWKVSLSVLLRDLGEAGIIEKTQDIPSLKVSDNK